MKLLGMQFPHTKYAAHPKYFTTYARERNDKPFVFFSLPKTPVFVKQNLGIRYCLERRKEFSQLQYSCFLDSLKHTYA